MKKGKRKIIIILLSLILVLISVVLIYFNFNLKNNNSLTLEENKWIDENKYNVIDVALMNDIPILSYDGQGYVYDYLDYVSESSSLKFNIIAYKLDGNSEYDYKMNIVDKLSENDISLYKDNLVLLTYNDVQYTDIREINNLRIGILSTDREQVNNYLQNGTITYVDYNNYTDLKNALITSKSQQVKDENTLDGIIVLRDAALKEIIENDLNIAYNFEDLNKYFVLTINKNNTLKSILNKKYNIWKKNSFDELHNEYLLNNYFKFKNITDLEQKTLKSKNYVFGFINYGIYNYLDGNKLSGLNGVVLKEFNEFSGLSITYTQYNSIKKLLDDFNSNKVDFVFSLVDENKYKVNTYKTNNIYDKDLIIVSENNSNLSINSIKSLSNKKVLTIKDSYLESYLTQNNIKYTSYNNMEDLTKDFGSSDVVITDMENFNYYKTSAFKNSRISYLLNTNDKYNFVINDKEENKLFEQLLDFYLSYNSINKITSENYEVIVNEKTNYVYIIIIVMFIFGIYIVLDFYNHLKTMFKTVKKNKKEKLTKEEKIKYIDQLTSLKNRAYLNSRIESWDESEVYPQSIIIIDLNNISYVNDNYGREEGDKVITEAANILIQNQLQNSEIIRTDGNEFLIYLVGYSEKQIISYLRKLNKEFKGLSHGFGVASGYSIITDAIKTVDDAVNEATLAMKENKEDIDY